MKNLTKIAIIGDVHSFWDEDDYNFFSNQNFSAIFFTGDLPGRLHHSSRRILKSISNLKIPVYFTPGNHDAITIPQLLAQIFNWQRLAGMSARKQPYRVRRWYKRLAPGFYGAYASFPLPISGLEVGLICGRPHSMGGGHVSFAPFMQKEYGVRTISDSVKKYKEVIDSCGLNNIIFLNHNGPSGLGDRANSIWGLDFRKEQGDFGDPDLAQAISYAKQNGKNVLAVIAGHMHHHVGKHASKFGERTKMIVRDQTIFVNAARVPRIFIEQNNKLHYFMTLEFVFEKDKWQLRLIENFFCDGRLCFENELGKLEI